MIGDTEQVPFGIVKAMVRDVLATWENRAWTLQGFGMLRTYLDEEKQFRLHIWDDRYTVPGVTRLHTHPWDMESFVVAGQINNVRYITTQFSPEAYYRQDIACGIGGGLENDKVLVHLENLGEEQIFEGDIYRQAADEIHDSKPMRGTVTIIKREFHEDTEHAYVYWPVAEQWVSAEPAPAKREDVAAIVGNSLATWFPVARQVV